MDHYLDNGRDQRYQSSPRANLEARQGRAELNREWVLRGGEVPWISTSLPEFQV